MADLRPNARALLEEARQAVSPSATDIAELRARLAQPPPPPEPSATAGSANGLVYTVVALVAMAIAAVIAAWLGSSASPAAETLEPLGRWVPSPMAASEPAKPGPPPPTTSAGPPATALPDLPEPPKPSLRTSKPKPKPKPKPKSKQSDGLAAELELITAARKALKSGRHAKARDSARTYLRRFGRGSFVEEAKVLALVAECNLARSDAAVRQATAYLDAGNGAFAKRVRIACLEPR